MNYKHLSESDVKALLAAFPSEENISLLANVFKIFGDQTRLKIIMSLFDQELCVHDIAKVAKVSQSAVSHQLRNLREAKLVKFRREGKEVIYQLDDEHVQAIFNLGLAHVLEASEDGSNI